MVMVRGGPVFSLVVSLYFSGVEFIFFVLARVCEVLIGLIFGVSSVVSSSWCCVVLPLGGERSRSPSRGLLPRLTLEVKKKGNWETPTDFRRKGASAEAARRAAGRSRETSRLVARGECTWRKAHASSRQDPRPKVDSK